MLKSITQMEAFKMLMDEGKKDKVYFKHNKIEKYCKAVDYKWIFESGGSGVFFNGTDFYEEVED